MARAASSLPVPVSPWISTVASQAANLLMRSIALRNPGAEPTRLNRSSAFTMGCAMTPQVLVFLEPAAGLRDWGHSAPAAGTTQGFG